MSDDEFVLFSGLSLLNKRFFCMKDIFLHVFEGFLLVDLIDPICLLDFFQLLSQLVNLISLLDVQIDSPQVIQVIDSFNFAFYFLLFRSDPLYTQSISVFLSEDNKRLTFYREQFLLSFFYQSQTFSSILNLAKRFLFASFSTRLFSFFNFLVSIFRLCYLIFNCSFSRSLKFSKKNHNFCFAFINFPEFLYLCLAATKESFWIVFVDFLQLSFQDF